jgi:hypothetical protein
VRDSIVDAALLPIKTEFDRGYQQGAMMCLKKVNGLFEKLMEGERNAMPKVRRQEQGQANTGESEP